MLALTRRTMLAAAGLAVMWGTEQSASALTFQLNKNQPGANHWLVAADWDDLTTPLAPSPVPPAAGDIANTTNRLLRTTTGSGTFPATLNIDAGGTVLLKTTGTATISDGHLLGGALSQGIAPNSTGTFGGSIAVDAVSTIALNSLAGDVRTLILAANLSGANNLTVDGGNGAAVGTLRLTGSIANYTGAFNLIDNAVLDVRGTALSIGLNNNNGFTASGGLVKFGTGTETMDVSRNTVAGSGLKTATADVSGATGVQVNLALLQIGTLPSSANPGSGARGTFILSQAGSNSIIAPTILIGDSPGSGNTNGFNELVLGGAANTIDTTTFTIGGQKSDGRVRFGTPGGVLSLGTAGDRVTNLRLGFNNASGTGANTQGVLDGTGGTINAFVTNMVLGQHAGGGAGSGKGTLTLAAGLFDVTSAILGQPSGTETGTAELNTVGTINLNGGTLKAGSITKGLGTAVFNFNGGVLSANTFGLPLTQLGGTLAPGMEMAVGSTDITGNYSMNSLGMLAIDVANAGSHDFVDVAGIANLDGVLKLIAIGGFVPGADVYDVLHADAINLGATFSIDTSMFQSRVVRSSIVDGGNGTQLLRLSVVVPEPATALLAVFGAGLAGLRRRRAIR